MIVLDTSAIIELLDGTEKGKKVEQLIADEDVAISVIAVNEFLVGGSQQSKQTFKDFTDAIKILDFDDVSAFRSVSIEESLIRKGKPIGKLDCFIAAICLVHNLPLITCDKDFKNVNGLKISLIE